MIEVDWRWINMAVPLDGIRAFHNAFRKDIKAMDTAADSAVRGKAGLDMVVKRHSFFNEILAWHAHGEEKFVFTRMESVAPLVAEADARDHGGLDRLSYWLEKEVKSSDKIAISHAASAFNFFLTFHLDKEEAHLYKIFDERVPQPDQWDIIAKVSQGIPAERFPETINWLFPLIGPEDQENMIKIFQRLLPLPAFKGATQLIKESIGDDWKILVQRIPDLK
jgi:hemerythrin-like domain-containing protein